MVKGSNQDKLNKLNRRRDKQFDHNSKLACHVHEHHHHMDFENVEVVGHKAHYHQRLFLEAWMSVKDPNAGYDHMVIPEVYKCLART